jgi:hypothetical protein
MNLESFWPLGPGCALAPTAKSKEKAKTVDFIPMV